MSGALGEGVGLGLAAARACGGSSPAAAAASTEKPFLYYFPVAGRGEPPHRRCWLRSGSSSPNSDLNRGTWYGC